MKKCLAAVFFILLFTPIGAGALEVASFKNEIQQEFQRHNYKKVIRLYNDFVEKNPGHYVPVVVKVLYSQSLADTGEVDDAADVLKEVLADLPPEVDSLKLQYDLANLLFMLRRYAEAKAVYQKILLQSSHVNEMLARARGRIGLMKGSEGRKKDVTSLQLLDIETSLEASEVPDGAEAILQGIVRQEPPGPHAERAKRLLETIRGLRTQRAVALLAEARRLFDEERKYTEVHQILEQISREYADVGDMQSVELLLKEVNRRLGIAAPPIAPIAPTPK